MIHEEICTYEVCKLAKEKGFDVPTDRYYHIYDDVIEAQNSLEMTGDGCADFYNSLNQCRCAAPTQSLLQRWLREEKGYYVYPFFDNESKRWTWVCRELTVDKWIQLLDFEERYFDTYELALEDAELYVLKNLL